MSPQRLKLYNWHKWAGVDDPRAVGAAPAVAPDAPAAGRSADAGLAAPAPRTRRTALLYLLFFAVPLAGWAYSSAAGFPIVVFGVLPLPDFVPVDKALAEVFKPLHKVLAYSLARWCCVHVAAALKHQFVDRDGLLARMRFGRA